MIIVEGPDGGGKTTLVQHLAQRFDIPIAERVVSKEATAMVDLKHWTERNLKEGLQWMIFDRHRLISGPIYNACLRRPAHDGFDDITWFTARMLDFTRIRPFIVYCMPGYDFVVRNLTDDESNEVIFYARREMYDAYIAQAAGDVARGQAVLFNYNHDPAYDRIDMLFETWIRANRGRLAKAGKVF